VRIEVEMVQEEGGIFRATAVSYPDVSVTGRTEKEALGLLLEAVGKYLKTHSEHASAPSQVRNRGQPVQHSATLLAE
jgi:predicted RNase H-like HicB family nuclease